MKPKVPTLTRKDIAHYISLHKNIKSCEVDVWVDSVLEAIRDLLMTADPEIRLELRDFGVFEVKMTKAKPRARNPKTGDRLYVPSRRKTHFKPSKYLRSFLNEPLSPDEEMLLLKREEEHKHATHPENLSPSFKQDEGEDLRRELHETEEHIVG
jgi:integration host factor subunit beta